MERAMGGKVEVGGADIPLLSSVREGGMHVASCEGDVLRTRRESGCFSG